VTDLPKAILFDLDDTIISFGDRNFMLLEIAEEFQRELAPITPKAVAEAIDAAFIRFWSDEVRSKHWRFRLLEARIRIISEVFSEWPNLAPDLAGRVAERYHEYREGWGRFFPGAIEALAEIKRRGVKLALVTNGEAEGQRQKVTHFDLARFFDHVQIEGEVGFGKPEERAYLHAMEKLGVTPAETWMVGDNLEWEVAAPQRLGIYSIWHDHLGRGLPPGCPIRPDRIIVSIAELVP
jgi:putative hydrolase of the HAD superfamily